MARATRRSPTALADAAVGVTWLRGRPCHAPAVHFPRHSAGSFRRTRAARRRIHPGSHLRAEPQGTAVMHGGGREERSDARWCTSFMGCWSPPGRYGPRPRWGSSFASIPPLSRTVIGGVDTHKDLHVAAVIDTDDRVLGTHAFSTTRAGYRAMLAWMRTFGDVRRIGVEGTGSYGAGLLRHLQQASRSSRSTVPTAPTGADAARTTPWTPRTPPTPPWPGPARSPRRRGPAWSRACASCVSPALPPSRPAAWLGADVASTRRSTPVSAGSTGAPARPRRLPAEHPRIGQEHVQA